MKIIHHPHQIDFYNEQNQLVAEITFPAADPDTVNIDHTFVDDSLRGQGVAAQLMDAAIQQIEQENKKIIPSCSYAKSWFEKHPEYHYLLHT